jgi:hypothetical protein
MIKKERKTEVKQKELTPKEEVVVLRQQVEDLKAVMDEIILGGMI